MRAGGLRARVRARPLESFGRRRLRQRQHYAAAGYDVRGRHLVYYTALHCSTFFPPTPGHSRIPRPVSLITRTNARTRSLTRSHSYTRADAHTRVYTRSRTRAHSRTHTHTIVRTKQHSCARSCCCCCCCWRNRISPARSSHGDNIHHTYEYNKLYFVIR